MNSFKRTNSIACKALTIITLAVFLLMAWTSNAMAEDLVKQVQQSLVEKGLNPGPVDGFWGSKTEKALMAFQKNAGLEANGKLDKQTKALLFAGKAVSHSEKKSHAKPSGNSGSMGHSVSTGIIPDVDPSEVAENPNK